MALGDGIRRNILTVDAAERALLRDAFIELNQRSFPGNRTDIPPGGVTWWFKQDEIHQATHVHGGAEFLPWHRVICNRIEELLRQIDPRLSLHYWNFNEDPASLFTADFMGSPSGSAGNPWLDARYYDPAAGTAGHPEARDTSFNPADPPSDIARDLSSGALLPISDISPGSAFGIVCPAIPINNDDDIISAEDYSEFRVRLECVHNFAHGHIGGTLNDPHISFRDPVVFLVHSNVDRIFARWQTEPSHAARLDPATVYGADSGDSTINSDVEPWSGGAGTRPWSPPESQGIPFDYKHPSVVVPPCYDTNFSNNNALVEVINDSTPPVILFNDIPEGETGARAAVFRVYGCRDVTIRVKAGTEPSAPFLVLSPASGSVPVLHQHTLYVEARIWFGLHAPDPAASVPDDSVTIECPETGQEFIFTLQGTVIEKPSVAVMLSLDQSASMEDDAGTSGRKRIDVLTDAAKAFAELIPANDGMGLVRFDHDAYDVGDATWPGKAITRITTDDDFDPERIAAVAAVDAHVTNPSGFTSVGDGVAKARGYLSDPGLTGYNHKAMIVFTDGLQNRPQSIEDVAGSIDNRTFAIGLGNEYQVDTGALYDLTHGTGGFLLLTGLLSDTIDDFFRTKKYFLQILSGVINDNVVLDPNGYITPGNTVRIPFYLNETDIMCSAVLLWDYPVIDFAIEAPSGAVIDMSTATGLGIVAKLSSSSGLYRFTLPVALDGGQHAGRWHVVLKINGERYAKYGRGRNDSTHAAGYAFRGARYSVQVNARSNLKMKVRVEQSDFAPGSPVLISAGLTEYGIPMEHRASCKAIITKPDLTTYEVGLAEAEPGRWHAQFNTDLLGIYRIRTMARGVTMRGKPFTCEESRTAAAFRLKQGGTDPHNPTEGGRPSSGDGTDDKLLELIARCCKRSSLLIGAILILLLIILLLLVRLTG